jgi:hypothetical protein
MIGETMVADTYSVPAATLSPALRGKLIRDLARGETSWTILSIAIGCWCLSFPAMGYGFWLNSHLLVLAGIGLLFSPYALRPLLTYKKEEEMRGDFALYDDDMLLVLHAELRRIEQTKTMACVVLGAAVLVCVTILVARH